MGEARERVENDGECVASACKAGKNMPHTKMTVLYMSAGDVDSREKPGSM